MRHFVPLTPERFKDQYWERYRDYHHLKHQHWVAVTAPEMTRVAAHLPMGFVKLADSDQVQLGALMALKMDENYCVTQDNRWAPGYTPALLRVHPFRVLPTQKGSTQRTLCVDADSPWLNAPAGERFFNADESPSDSVKEVLKFLTELEQHLFKTQQAVDLLSQMDLLVPFKISNLAGGQLEGVLQVDEAKLNQLSDDQWLQLRRSGGLAIAYAQIISSGQIPALHALGKAQGYVLDDPDFDVETLFGDDEELSFDF